MPPLSEVLSTSLPPIVAALLLVGWRGARLTALAISLGVFVTWWWNRDWELPPWPHQLLREPIGAQWLLWSIIGAGFVTTLEHARLLSGRVAGGVGVVFVALATYLILQKVAASWSAGEVVLRVSGGGLAVALAVLATRKSLARAPTTIAPAVVFSLLASLLSVLMVVGAQDAALGKLSGAIGAALGAAAGTWLWRKPFALTAADGTCLGGAWGLLVLAGAHLASLPLAAAGCAMLSPFALLLLRPSVAQGSVRWSVAALVLAGAPMVAAFAIALAAHGSEGY